jgi:hypothetical protein
MRLEQIAPLAFDAVTGNTKEAGAKIHCPRDDVDSNHGSTVNAVDGHDLDAR